MPADQSEIVVTPFAQAIHAKSALLRSDMLTLRQRSRLLESISDDIKKCADILLPEVQEQDKRGRVNKGN